MNKKIETARMGWISIPSFLANKRQVPGARPQGPEAQATLGRARFIWDRRLWQG